MHQLSITGTILTDVDFYYRKLSIQPSKLATINYNITIPGDYKGHVIVYINTTDNMEEQCSKTVHGQSFNRQLHSHFKRDRWYSGTEENVFCYKKNSIQDFIPRNCALSLGFYCEDK